MSNKTEKEPRKSWSTTSEVFPWNDGWTATDILREITVRRVLTTAETSSVSAWFNQLHIRAVVIAEATRWVSITTVATVGVILPPIIVRLQSITSADVYTSGHLDNTRLWGGDVNSTPKRATKYSGRRRCRATTVLTPNRFAPWLFGITDASLVIFWDNQTEIILRIDFDFECILSWLRYSEEQDKQKRIWTHRFSVSRWDSWG